MNSWKFRSKFTNVVILLKVTTAQKPTMEVIKGNILEDNLPLQPTLRRAAPASARKIMQDT